MEEIPESTRRYLICQHMHWDYWTYQAQPAFYRDEVWEHYLEERAVEAEQSKAKVNHDDNVAAWEELRAEGIESEP